MEHPTGVVSINSEIAQEKPGGGGGGVISLTFIPPTLRQFKRDSGFVGVDFPELDVPTPPALAGLEQAPGSPCKRRDQPRRGTASAPCKSRSPRTRVLPRG